MNVCVQGLWHLGSVTAACLASLGNRVVGLDFDEAVISRLREGRAPVLEPGLDDLIRVNAAERRLSFSADLEQAVRDVEVLWVAYDTPVDDDDRADVEYVIDQVARTLGALPDGATVVVSSQLPVGSVGRLESLARDKWPAKDLGFASAPENLRLGKALEVFLKPDRIVLGVRRKRDLERLDALLRPVTDRIECMSVESAEMTKHAINAFLATSVTFANELASICEVVGADAKEVERGLKTDARIGPKAYVSPGSAFAGGTLARDIVFLSGIGGQKNVTTPLLSSVKTSNDTHRDWVKRRLTRAMPNLDGVRVAIWGLTYKPGTDTLRRSLSVELCNWLLARNVMVTVHDPAVTALPDEWHGRVVHAADPIAAVEGAEVLIVGTEWPVYRQIGAGDIARGANKLIVIDPNRHLSDLAAREGIRYMAVGTPDTAS